MGSRAKRCYTCAYKQKQVLAGEQRMRRRLAKAVGLEFVEGSGHGRDFSRHVIRTHAEVAQIMGLTPQRVTQLEQSAFAKIRKALGPLVAA